MIELHDLPLVDFKDPLSKALSKIKHVEDIVGVIKDKKLYGIIDERHLSRILGDTSQVKAGRVAIKAPRLKEDVGLEDLLHKFSTNHFRALPVVDSKGQALGYIKRSDLLEELLSQNLVPRVTAETVMKTPPYTISSNETIGRLRALMKELAVSHLVVREHSKVIGVVSTFDLMPLRFAPELKASLRSRYKVGDFVNKRLLVLVAPTECLVDVVKKLAETGSSFAVVENPAKGIRPLGVIPVRDVLALVLKAMTEGPQIIISGLPEDEGILYDDIKEELSRILAKLAKMFEVGHAYLRIKEGKSVYRLDLTVELNGRRYRFHDEDYDIMPAVNRLMDTLERAAGKIKELSKKKGESIVEVIEEYGEG